MNSTVATRVREYWTTSGVGARPGALVDEIVSFETLHRFPLPASVAHFYATVNGMEADGPDGEMFVAFPLAEVRPVPEAIGSYRGSPDYGPVVQLLPDANDYFVFGECMIWSQVLAVRLRPESGTPVLWISGSTYTLVASTFDDFWERYLREPADVLYAPRELL